MLIPIFLKFIVIKLIGLKNIFLRNFIIILSGNMIIDIIVFIIFFIIVIIFMIKDNKKGCCGCSNKNCIYKKNKNDR